MNIKIKLINNNLEKWMNSRYSGNLTKLLVFYALLFGKSIELYNHKEWSILIYEKIMEYITKHLSNYIIVYLYESLD